MKPDELMLTPATELLTEATALKSTDPVSKAIGLLNESGLMEAFADDGDGTTGIVTMRDLLNVDNLNTKIASVMHKVPRLGLTDSVGDAAALMREFRTRSVPVYKGKKLTGQVTSPSIVARLLESDLPGRISSIMSPGPACLDPSDPVSKARETMIKKKVDQLPVTKRGELVGIVTSAEIVFNLLPKSVRTMKGGQRTGRYDEAVGTFAESAVTTNEITDTLRTVYQNMSNRRSNYSVIVGPDGVEGIVTYRDFLTVLSNKATQEPIPMYMVGLPDDPFEAETARKKFLGAVELLRKSVPDISEARAVIKVGQTKAPKKRYEVKVFLAHPRERFSYSVKSYELADAFDEVNHWVKEVIARSRPRKGKGHNARSYPADFRPETAPG